MSRRYETFVTSSETERAPQAIRPLGETATLEAYRSIIDVPEISPERAATFETIDQNKRYGLFCGDARELTEDSSNFLHGEEHLRIDKDAMFRYFGGVVGLNRVLLIASSVQANNDARVWAKLNNNFVGSVQETARRISEKQPHIIPGVHCAEGPYQNPTQFDPDSKQVIGCKYCVGIGAVTCLCMDEDVVKLGHDEQLPLFGNSRLLPSISDANAAFARHYFSNQPITRQDIDKTGFPVAILKEKAITIRGHGVITVQNYTLDKVSRPRLANEAGVSFYNNDMTAGAEALMRAYPELKLDPEILLPVMDQDIRATRAALASIEGLEAADMQLQRYGDPRIAIDYLKSIQV